MDSSSPVTLTPAQKRAYDGVLRARPAGEIFTISGAHGRGRTTVLRALHAELGGVLLPCAPFLEAGSQGHPLSLEDAVANLILNALDAHPVVLVDDWHVLVAAMTDCHFYPRAGWLGVAAEEIARKACERRRTLVVASRESVAAPLQARSYHFGIDRFAPEDYAHLLHAYLDPKTARRIDVSKVYRFAPKLDAHQLRGACSWLRTAASPGPVDTDRLIGYLRAQRLTSNVELGEVSQVELRDLKGIDDVIEALEAGVVMPLENDELAQRLGLTPKRGVLLAGPPGTGKTTIGRALAHRLRGKFFLIDGTMISGTRQFYDMVHRVFRAAQENAPAVVFIDDSDVIFESGQEHGLYRYLLTMLDGLESESASRVCVMMTAMDVANIPPAMVRSGRVELWLETRLPDEVARADILREAIATLPEELGSIDVDAVVATTEGFTGADLTRTIGDAKTLYAYDLSRQMPLQSMTAYALQAAQIVLANREKYLAAETRTRASRPTRPPWFGAVSFGYDPDVAIDLDA